MAKDAPRSLSAMGKRLRAARLTTGLSARAVCDRLRAFGHHISHATICNYELGKTVPPMPVVGSLAELYERTVEWILDDGPLISDVRYRCLKSVRVAEKRKYEGEALGWLRAYLAAEEALGEFENTRSVKVTSQDTGEGLARKVRKEHNLGEYPVPSVCQLLANFGIRVIQLRSDSRIDGLAAWLGDIPVVVLNSDLSNDRIRMNAAHELGHHLFRDSITGSNLSEKEIEQRAFSFASNLLIPDLWLEEAFRLKSMVRLVQYKERFGISLAAMIFRARRRKLVPQSLYQKLWRDFSRLGWRQNEPGHVQPDRPARMEALFDAAIRQGKLSLTDISRLAGTDEQTVEDRILKAAGATYRDMSSPREGTINLQTHRDDSVR